MRSICARKRVSATAGPSKAKLAVVAPETALASIRVQRQLKRWAS